MKIYDFTHTLRDRMIVWPGDPPVLLERALKYEDVGANATFMKMGAHSGTHVDAPLSYSLSGECIEGFPLEKWVGYGSVLHIPKKGGEVITREDLSSRLVDIEEDILLISTGWESKFGMGDYYVDYPHFSPDVVEFLVEKGVKMIGADIPSADPPDGSHPFSLSRSRISR